MTPTDTRKVDLGCEKEDLRNVGAGGFNGRETVNAWKQLLSLKPTEGGKFKPKLKKKIKKIKKNIKKGAKSGMMGGHLGGSVSSQLGISFYFCSEARGTPMGVPKPNDARE